MAKKQLGAIDADLLRRVDEAAGDVPRVRWVERVLEREVSRRETNDRYFDTGEGTPIPDLLPPLRTIPVADATLSKLAADPDLTVELGPEQVKQVMAFESGRKCERCAKPYTSPTLRRCNVCNGRILPEPE